jgi:nucleoside 2-deoxyribosyltransferase
MYSVYFAGPLFSEAEIQFNANLASQLREHGYSIFLPQDECNGKTLDQIFATCRKGIDNAEVVIAILDGADADSGTCWECGYAYAKGKPVVAVRTDFRESGDTKGFNAMLYYGASAIVMQPKNCAEEILSALKKLKK